MADATKTIRFKLNIETNGDGKIKALAVDSNDLAEAIAHVRKAADEAKSKFEKWGGASVMLNGIASCVNNLNTVMQGLAAAYQAQEQNEMRLAQAMENTMNATAEEIQSIKDLCSAQQELGVIGDEVLLQGAQEMAMHMQNADSLKTLIPVMNDVITQQYGIGASGENAASVGKMFGKIMEGNTAPLKRLGITLTDAEKHLIEFGDETTRASVLSSVLEQRFGGMAEAAGQTASGKLARLNNAIGDLKENIGACVKSATPMISIIAQIGMATSGYMSMVKGLNEAFTKQKKAATEAATATKIFGVSLKSVLITTGLGAALLVFGTVLEKLMGASNGASESLKQLKEAEEEGQRAYSNATTEIKEQRNKLQELVSAHKDTTIAVNELNLKYGEIFGTYKTATEWLDVLASKEKEYARQMYLRGKTSAIANQIGELEGKNAQLRQRNDELKETGGFDIDVLEGKEFAHRGKNGGRQAGRNAVEFNKNARAIEENEKALAELNTEYEKAYSLEKATADALKSNGGENVFDEAKASSEQLGKEIQRLQDQLRKEFNSETKNSPKAKEIQDEIKKLQAQKTALDKTLGSSSGTSSTKVNTTNIPKISAPIYDEASVAYAEQQISEIQKKLREVDPFSLDVEELNQELDYWLKESHNRKIKVGLEVDDVEISEDAFKPSLSKFDLDSDLGFDLAELESTRQDRTMSMENANANIDYIKDAFSFGMIDETEAQRLIDEINAQLEAIGLEPLELVINADKGTIITATEDVQKRMETLQKKINEMTDLGGAIGSMGSSFSQLGSAIGGATGETVEFIGSFAQGIGQLIPQIMTLITAKEAEALASGTASAAQAPWFMAIPTIASIVATIGGIFASLPKFADGGIAYGPTLGLFGEYAGASNNPEVVAPLNTLRDLIKTDDPMTGRVVFEIDGRKLRGVLQKVDKIYSRS